MTDAERGRGREPLYRYQSFSAEKIVRRPKTGLIAAPGSGKTRIIIESLYHLGLTPDHNILIICSGPAIATWKWQIPYWNLEYSPDDIHVVRGSKADRTKMWARAKNFNTRGGVYITNPSVFRIDFEAIHNTVDNRRQWWDAVVCDEYHKYMRRHKKNQTFARFRPFSRHMDIMILCSGSLLRKDPTSLWTLFNLVDPHLKTFRSYYRFVDTFCLTVESVWGGNEIVGPKNVERLKELMDRYLAYIPREVVADQLPDGVRRRMPVEMSTNQRNIYNTLVEEMIVMYENGEFTIAPTKMAVAGKLRQLLCCPKILNEDLEYGAGFEAIVDALTNGDDAHAAIFVPFRLGVTYIAQGLREVGFEHVYEVMGGISPDELAGAVKAFRENRGIMVCTIDYAESFDLETCCVSYFLGYSYVTDQNMQAEGRTQRAHSKHDFVTWNYIMHMESIDEVILESLNEEHRMIEKIMSRPQAYIEALKGLRPTKNN